MIRMILIWLILTVSVGFGISAWRGLTGKEQWQLTKYIVYATLCSLVAVALLGILIVLF